MLKSFPVALVILSVTCIPSQSRAVPTPESFESVGADRSAIEALLATYTKAVSTKDRALFETLLLNQQIAFAGIGSSGVADNSAASIAQYPMFRMGVFSGASFTQRFQDVHIDQDGPIASVSLVFVNSGQQGSSWGWKTMQLLKFDGRWKIASEFFTAHPG